MSTTTRFTISCRQGSGNTCKGSCTSLQRVPISAPGGPSATLTTDPPPVDTTTHHHPTVNHNPWIRHQPSPTQPQGAPQPGNQSQQQAPQCVLQDPIHDPTATERSPVSQTSNSASDPSTQMLREVEALRQEVKAFRDQHTKMQECQHLKTMCASHLSIPATLTTEIQTMKDLLRQLVADNRANKQTCRKNGMSVETDVSPPTLTHPEQLSRPEPHSRSNGRDCDPAVSPHPTLTHPGQLAALPTQMTQPRQPAMLHTHADQTPASPHTQISPSTIQCTVKPKHQQTNKQRHAQSQV